MYTVYTLNDDGECCLGVLFLSLCPFRFVEQLRQGGQELGSQCQVASRQMSIMVISMVL